VWERPSTLRVVSPTALALAPEIVCGLELRYVFDRHLVTWEDRRLKVLLENRLLAPGYRLFTMLTPEEIIAAANEPMPGPG
jgi:hypothetical protein